MTINAVLLAVVIMLGLSLARVHVVLSLLIGALAGGLIAGLGMSLSMQVIGGTLPLTVLGLALGIIGFTCTAVNYPIYKKMLEKGKKKYAYEIVELAREISEEK